MSSRDDLFRFTPVKPILEPTDPHKEIHQIALEKWLCATRICKTRALARQYLERGRIRSEAGEPLYTNTLIKIGDRFVIEYGYELRCIQVTSLIKRPAGADQNGMRLYMDIPLRQRPQQPQQHAVRKKPVQEQPYFPSDYVNGRAPETTTNNRTPYRPQQGHERNGGVNFLRRSRTKAKFDYS